MINILHIVENYSISSGGLRTVIKNLDFYLKQNKIGSYILSASEELNDNIFIVKTTKIGYYAKGWYEKIDEIVNSKNINIIHIHGVWTYPNYIGAKYALKNKISYVLSPHGMYESYIWSKGKMKKKLYFNLVVKSFFKRASVFHTITPEETQKIKVLFKKENIFELPNLITFYNYEQEVDIQKKYILYLGRINEKKGIDTLINSFSKIKDENLVLKIAGGFNDYKLKLEFLAKSLNIENKIEFLDQVRGEQKNKLIKEAWVMVAPSFSEVIGMVNLEAGYFKTPMITTYQTGLLRDWSNNGGILINPLENELIIAIKKALNWTIEERIERGNKLHNFVKENYSWKSRIKNWLELYEKALN